MDRKEALAAFGAAVHEFWPRMLGKAGFEMVQDGPEVWMGESSTFRISMFLDGTAVEMEIQPIDPVGEERAVPVNLYWVLLALDPKKAYLVKQLEDDDAVRVELHKQLTLMTSYGKRMFEGDYSDWKRIQYTVKTFRGPGRGERRSEWADKLRHIGQDAYRKGIPALQMEAYASLQMNGQKLTWEESHRLKSARTTLMTEPKIRLK